MPLSTSSMIRVARWDNYAAARIERSVERRLEPVAIAPGSVLVDPRLPNSLPNAALAVAFPAKRDAAMHKYGTGSNSDRLLG